MRGTAAGRQVGTTGSVKVFGRRPATKTEPAARIKVMTLAPDEFIRRFLTHVLPSGFHRIRHYGLLASSQREQNIAQAHQLLNLPAPQPQPAAAAANAHHVDDKVLPQPCPCCGGRMMIIEVFARDRSPRYRAATPTLWVFQGGELGIAVRQGGG